MKEKFTQEQKAELLRIALDAYKIHADVNQTYDNHPYSVHTLAITGLKSLLWPLV